MKIVHLITGLTVGGAERLLYNRLAHFNKDKNDHHVVYFHEGKISQKIRGLGIRTDRIRGLFSPYDPIGLLSLIFLIKKIDPDIIHSYLWSANFLGRFLSVLFRVPLICDLHSDVIFHGWFRNFLDRLTIRIPKKFIAVSATVEKSFKANIGYVKNKAIPMSVIKNGIDIERLHGDARRNVLTRESLGFSSEDFIIGTVGRLYSIKSQDILIESFACLKQDIPYARLCIVGDGPERAYLENLVQILKISKDVVFVGQQEHVAPYYSLFDCFVLSSRSEGMSAALLEALCFGLPVVVTHKEVEHDVVKHGVNGFVVPIGNRGKILEAIKKLYGYPQIRSVIGKRNRDDVKLNFDISLMINSYESLYKTFER